MTSPMSSVVGKYESHPTPITPPDRPSVVDDLQQPISPEPQQPKQLMILRRTPEVSRPPSENGQASVNFIMEATPSPSDMSPSESGTPSAASSVVGDDDDLVHESSLHANMPVEGFLIAALRNTQDRLLLLKLDKELEAFLNDPKRTKLEFPRMNSYQRMVVHKVAEYFKITHVPDSTKKAVVLFKSEESAVPSLRFAELIEQEDDEQPQQKVVIMKRQSSKNQRGIPSITSSTPNMDGSPSALAEDRKNMTFEEREAAYKKARAKIFGEGNGSGNEGDDKEGTDKNDLCSVTSNLGVSANDGDENSVTEVNSERPKLMTRTSSGKSRSSNSGNSKQSSSRNSPASSKTRNSRPSISNTDIIPRPPTQPSQPPPPAFASNFNGRPSGPIPGMNPYILTQSYPGQPYYNPSNYDANNFNAVPQQPQNIALDGVQPPQYFNAGATDRVGGHGVYGPRPLWPNNSQLGPRSYSTDMNTTNPNNTYFYPHRPQMQSTTQPQGYPISVGRIHQQRDDLASTAFPPLPTVSSLQTGPRSAVSYTSGAWNMRPNNSPNFYGVVGGESLDGQFEQNQPRATIGYGGTRPPNTLDGQNMALGAMGNNQKQWGNAPSGDIGFTGNGRGGNISENKEGQNRPQQQGPKRHQFQTRPFFFPNMPQNMSQSPQNGWTNMSWGNPSENMPPGGYFISSPTEYRPQYPLQAPLSAPVSPMIQSNLASAGLGLGPRHSGTDSLLQQQLSRLHLSEQSPIISAGTLPNSPVTVYDVERRPPKSTELFDPNSPISSSGGASASNGSKVYNPTRRKEESGNGGSPGPGSSTPRSVGSLSSSVTPSPSHRTPPNNSSPLRKKDSQSSGLLFDYTSQNSYEGVKPSEAAAPRAFEHILELYDMVEDDLLMDVTIPNANIKRLGPSAATGNRPVILAVFKKASVARTLLETGDCGRYKLRLWQPLPGGESISLIERSGEAGDGTSP